MQGLSLDQYTKDQLREMALIDVAYHHIKAKKEVLHFSEMMDVITTTLGLSKEEVKTKISQFYTDLNIDGRFLSLGENRWGLRSWYPVDQVDDEAVLFDMPKRKKKKGKKVEDDFDDYEELDEELEDDLLDDDEDVDEDDEEDEEDDIEAIDDEELDDEYEDFDEEELLDEEELAIDDDFDDSEEEER